MKVLLINFLGTFSFVHVLLSDARDIDYSHGADPNLIYTT
jgi:hypothetical protein